jgi:hypothetical protein
VSTTRPTILPARRSLRVAFTSSSGRVRIGTGGMPLRHRWDHAPCCTSPLKGTRSRLALANHPALRRRCAYRPRSPGRARAAEGSLVRIAHRSSHGPSQTRPSGDFRQSDSRRPAFSSSPARANTPLFLMQSHDCANGLTLVSVISRWPHGCRRSEGGRPSAPGRAAYAPSRAAAAASTWRRKPRMIWLGIAGFVWKAPS